MLKSGGSLVSYQLANFRVITSNPIILVNAEFGVVIV